MKSTAKSYGKVAVWFHWISMLLILVLAPMGMLMVRMPDGETRVSLYRLHSFIGFTVTWLTVFRVIWRFFDKSPEAPPGMSGWNLRLFKGVHIVLYAILLGLGFSGSAMLFLSGAMPPTNLTPEMIAADLPPRLGHSLFSKVFLALFAAHVGGVLLHQFTKGDVFSRIGVPWFKPKSA